ncbi:14218_t:CDS:2, partial [Racocetra persica]
ETTNGRRVKEFLEQEHENYKVYQEVEDHEDQLLQEYREAWQSSDRKVEFQQRERTFTADLVEKLQRRTRVKGQASGGEKDKVYHFEVETFINNRAGKILIDQITAIDKKRIGNLVSHEELKTANLELNVVKE